MSNDKCPMINDSGYALIAMVFILVSFLSVVLLACYPLVKEARDDSDSYIADRNDYRFRKAMFGEMVDQCGTKLAHTGGFYSDYDWGGSFSADGYHQHRLFIARIFGVTKRHGGEGTILEAPKSYRYERFWLGYWGKRYLQILPGDKWDYTTYYEPGSFSSFSGEDYNKIRYHPYWQPYLRIIMAHKCTIVGSVGNRARSTNYSYSGGGGAKFIVKDYSENRTGHELRLVSVGAINEADSMYFHLDEARSYYPDYVLYRFYQSDVPTSPANTAHCGQKNLMIQIREDGGLWITMDTKLLIHPPNITSNGLGEWIFRVNFYG